MASCRRRKGGWHKGPGATLCTRVSPWPTCSKPALLAGASGPALADPAPPWLTLAPQPSCCPARGAGPPHLTTGRGNTTMPGPPALTRPSSSCPEEHAGVSGSLPGPWELRGWVVLTPTFWPSNPQLYLFYPVAPRKGHRLRGRQIPSAEWGTRPSIFTV